MSDMGMDDYERVLPRDLFNEADLLKCLGRLVIELERTAGHHAEFGPDSLPSFRILQDQSSGAIGVVGLHLTVRGVELPLRRPLNARTPWPLVVTAPDDDPDFEDVRVFDGDGHLSPDMLKLIGADVR